LIAFFSNRGVRYLAGGAWIGALLLWAWVLSEIGLRATRPATAIALVHSEADPLQVARQIADAAPFGGSAPGERAAPPPAPTYSLVAVATGIGRDPGFAILEGPDGRRLSARLGETFAEDTRLADIGADYVQIERNGSREKIDLRRIAPPATPQARPAEAPATMPPAAAERDDGPTGEGAPR
jgi:hypothetical protein